MILKRFRLLLASVAALLTATAAQSAIQTNIQLSIQPTPSSFVDSRYPDGNDGTAGVIQWQTISTISLSTGVTGSQNLRTGNLTGSASATATLATTCSPALSGGFSTTADGLSWTSTTAYSGICRTTATDSGKVSYSNRYRVEAVAPPSADTTPPTTVTGLACAGGVGNGTCSWDTSTDVFEADGDAASGVKEYDVRFNGVIVATVPASAGLNKQYVETVIGSYTPTPTSTQSGPDWSLTSAGDIDGTDDLVIKRGAQVVGDAFATVKVESITNTTNFSKGGILVSNSHATNASYFGCYPYRNANGSITIQCRKRSPDGTNAASPSANITGVSLPIWIRVSVRTDPTLGELYSGEYSTNGNTFTAITTDYAMTLGSTRYWDLFAVATTASGGATQTTQFRQFSVNNVPRVQVTFNTLVPGTVDVRPRDNALNAGSYNATVSVTPTIPSDTTPPTFSVQPSGTSGGQTSINWSMGTATDANGIRGYVGYFCGTSATCVGEAAQTEQASNAITQTGLSASTTYYFRSKAIDPSGNVSSYSNIASIATDTGAPPAFTAPAITSVTPLSQTALRITHAAVTGADVYELRAADNVNGPFTQLSQFDHTGLTIDRTGLTAGQVGCYQVRANNTAKTNPGPWTATVDTLCGQTTAATGAIKWHPGHYFWPTTSTFVPSTQLTAILNSIQSVCSNNAVKGIQLHTAWASLEGPTQGDYSAGFAAVDQILTKLKSCGNKKLMLGMKDATYGSNRNTPGATSFSWLIPQYIMDSPTYGGSSAPYGIAYPPCTHKDANGVCDGAGNQWSGGLLAVSRNWEQPVMDRLIALSAAYAAHTFEGVPLDQSPYVEMVLGSETALGVLGGFNYSGDALVNQAKRRIAADAIAWPHTMQRVAINFVNSDANALSLMETCKTARNCVVGGPDPEMFLTNPPNTCNYTRTVQGNELYRARTKNASGNWADDATAFDYRTVMPWIGEQQDAGFNVRFGGMSTSCTFYTPAEIQAYQKNTMHMGLMVWIDGGRKSEILTQLASDSSVYSTACPSNFSNGCNTN